MSTDVGNLKDVLIALRQIMRAMENQAKRLARDTGLSTAQLISLQTIDQAGSLSAGELAKALSLSQATVTAITARLVERELITRVRHATDKRKVVLSISDAGRRIVEGSPSTLQALLEKRFEELKDWEQHQILAAVQRLSDLLDAQDISAGAVLDFGDLDTATAANSTGTTDKPPAAAHVENGRRAASR